MTPYKWGVAVNVRIAKVIEQPRARIYDVRYIVNRAGKADHLTDRKPFAVPTKTVSLRLNDLADTSVLLRIPSAQARPTKPPTLLRNQSRKPTLACEPVVSALTEVARLLQPGRCVT